MATWSVASLKQLSPFGAISTLSLWHGSVDREFRFHSERLERSAEMAMHWYLSRHRRADYVAAIIDVYLTIEGVKTDAMKMAARFGDFSAGIIIYLPYRHIAESPGIALDSPIVDFPVQFASLAVESERILRGLKRGRDRIRNRQIRVAAAWT
jgi:hypothetical protein